MTFHVLYYELQTIIAKNSGIAIAKTQITEGFIRCTMTARRCVSNSKEVFAWRLWRSQSFQWAPAPQAAAHTSPVCSTSPRQIPRSVTRSIPWARRWRVSSAISTIVCRICRRRSSTTASSVSTLSARSTTAATSIRIWTNAFDQ